MITCVPAYGRDYQRESEVKADFNAGKDFLIQDIGCRYNGSYINKSDAEGAGEKLKIRFDRQTKFVIC